jgi:uncharacterized lipoprotein YbaY
VTELVAFKILFNKKDLSLKTAATLGRIMQISEHFFQTSAKKEVITLRQTKQNLNLKFTSGRIKM